MTIIYPGESYPEGIDSNPVKVGLPAQGAIFIFFASFTGIFKSSVFNIFQNAVFALKRP